MRLRTPRAHGALLSLALLVSALAAGRVDAQQVPGIAPRWGFDGGLRVRAERWDWFDDTEAGRYWFAGALARLGVTRTGGPVGYRLELAAPVLLHLPGDAVQPAPAGQLGLGGTYRAANFDARDAVQLFPKNAYVHLARSRLRRTDALRVGRFEFDDGVETSPSSATLLAVKRERIASRLLGTFGWSHVGRSFDGAHFSRKQDGGDITAVVAAPTRGVFQADGWGTLPIAVAYGAWTRPVNTGFSSADLRLFALQYADFRGDVVKTDARPLADRQADDERIHVTTVGGHWLQALVGDAGILDLTLWGAGQVGAWGAQSHRALAGVAELGVQPAGLTALKPWLRGGISYGSGDDDAADGRHGTFFQVLPTPRPYARMPFYDMQNATDVYASVALRPADMVTLRLEAHRVRLSSADDLWYQGGGAYQGRSFGYEGRSAGGERDLASLLDVSAEFRFTPDFVLTAYLARANAGRAMTTAYPANTPGRFAYLELERRF